MDIKIKVLDGGKIPEYKSESASCADCYAHLEDSILIKSKERKLIPLGFILQLPKGYEAVIRPRSGYSLNGIDEIVGTIDADYRDEVNAIVINNTDNVIKINNGDRICQIKIQESLNINFTVVDTVDDTIRGDLGFGSTGR